MKTYLKGGIASSSQTVGSLLIPLAGKANKGNDLSIVPMDLTDLKIQTTRTSAKMETIVGTPKLPLS
jgi:hypothetical protein